MKAITYIKTIVAVVFFMMVFWKCSKDSEYSASKEVLKMKREYKVDAEELSVTFQNAKDYFSKGDIILPLEDLYIEMFKFIQEDLDDMEEKGVTKIYFVTTLSKPNNKLSIEAIEYYKNGERLFSPADFGAAIAGIRFRRISVSCHGGSMDGTSKTFKVNGLFGAKKLAKFSEACFDGGGCVEACSVGNTIILNKLETLH